MAYTVPTTQTDGNVIGASDWNTDMVENVKFLAGPPRCSAYRSSNLSLSASTETILTLNAEHYDTDGMHSTSVSTGRLTAVTAGYYSCRSQVWFAAASTGIRTLRMYFNGVGVTLEAEASNDAPGAVVAACLSVAKTILLDVGDYIECSVYQTTAGSLNLLGGVTGPSYVQAELIAVM
jgi:hypothetical protein